MKFVIAGDWHSDLHETEVSKSLRRFGHETAEFKWFHYFNSNNTRQNWLVSRLKRAQNKFLVGPVITKVNQDFVEFAKQEHPDAIFIYRGSHITADSLKNLRRQLPNCKLIGYNNDDPFSPLQPGYYWRHFKSAIPEYDHVFAYRTANLDDYKHAGAKNTDLMRSWFVPDRNYPVTLSPSDYSSFGTDVVFIGHYEPDQRVEFLEAIKLMGCKLRLFGPTKYWQQPLSQSSVLRPLAPLRSVWGDEYNKALCGAKIALCFFSKLNRDTYTRRCFEIPATRTFMLSEYSEDLASLFKEGVEAEFFRNKTEMLEKIAFYIRRPELINRIALAGYENVHSQGHDIDSRLTKMLDRINSV